MDKPFANFGPFLFLYPIFGPKNNNFRKIKTKTPRNIIIVNTLRYLINVGVKINVGSEIFLKFNKKRVKINVGGQIFPMKH